MVAALAAAGLPVAGVTPRHARDVAKATGPWAQTEALDARAFAPIAEAIRPLPRPLPDTQAAELRALLARRRPWVTMRTAKQHRLGRAPPRLLPDIQAHLTGLNTRLTTLDDDLDTTRRASPVWQEREELRRSVPGMGPVCARTRLLDAQSPQGRSPGSLVLSGLTNTFFCINPTKRVTDVFMTQQLPFFDPKAIALFRAYEAAVYEAL